MTEYTNCCECFEDTLDKVPEPQPSDSNSGILLTLGLLAGIVILSSGR